MKAMIRTNYGSPDVLQFVDLDKPAPKDDEVLVKVHAASLNIGDWYILRGKPFLVRLMAGGISKPKNTKLGADAAGRVEAIGKRVKDFLPGDDVFGDISACGFGAFAEYVCVPESAFALKPLNLSFEEAAAVPEAAVTALQGLRETGQVQPGQKVLVQGASGGVGTFAVQIAKAFGAEVTAVCSTRHTDTARLIGADHVIDYTREDFTRNGEQYDLILAVNGHRSLSEYKRALKPEGTYVCVGGSMRQIFESMLLGSMASGKGNKKMKNMGEARPNQKDLIVMKALIEAEKVAPVIDRCYPFDEAADAFRYLGEGHAGGKIVITME